MTHLLAFLFGGWFGFFIAALCVVGGKDDDN